ncbi:MAG: hypothetical protein AAF405_06515, partial [Pseudomonadota bacterium]
FFAVIQLAEFVMVPNGPAQVIVTVLAVATLYFMPVRALAASTQAGSSVAVIPAVAGFVMIILLFGRVDVAIAALSASLIMLAIGVASQALPALLRRVAAAVGLLITLPVLAGALALSWSDLAAAWAPLPVITVFGLGLMVMGLSRTAYMSFSEAPLSETQSAAGIASGAATAVLLAVVGVLGMLLLRETVGVELVTQPYPLAWPAGIGAVILGATVGLWFAVARSGSVASPLRAIDRLNVSYEAISDILTIIADRAAFFAEAIDRAHAERGEHAAAPMDANLWRKRIRWLGYGAISMGIALALFGGTA